jgi:hypothetical protein
METGLGFETLSEYLTMDNAHKHSDTNKWPTKQLIHNIIYSPANLLTK